MQETLDLYEVAGNLDPGEGGFDWSPGGGGTLSGHFLLKNFHKVHKDGSDRGRRLPRRDHGHDLMNPLTDGSHAGSGSRLW